MSTSKTTSLATTRSLGIDGNVVEIKVFFTALEAE